MVNTNMIIIVLVYALQVWYITVEVAFINVHLVIITMGMEAVLKKLVHQFVLLENINKVAPVLIHVSLDTLLIIILTFVKNALKAVSYA